MTIHALALSRGIFSPHATLVAHGGDDPLTCTTYLTVTLGPRVITDLQVTSKAKWKKIPFPEGEYYYTKVVATMFGVTPETLRNTLSDHRHRFDPPIYRRGSSRAYLMRLLSRRDVDTLRSIFTVRIRM